MGNCIACSADETKLRKYTYENTKDFSYEGLFVPCKVVSVYDGDTYRIVFFPKNQKKPIRLNVRAYGIDAPEIKPRKEKKNRDEEIKNAKRARNYFLKLVTDQSVNVNANYDKKQIKNIMEKNRKILYIELGKFGKYGRVLGTLYFDKKKTKPSVNQLLIDNDHAVQYFGGTKTR